MHITIIKNNNNLSLFMHVTINFILILQSMDSISNLQHLLLQILNITILIIIYIQLIKCARNFFFSKCNFSNISLWQKL